MYDAVLLFSQALKDMPFTFTTEPVFCKDTKSIWKFGVQIMEKMKSVNNKFQYY